MSGDEVNNSSWVACVKYKTGGKTEIRPISKIKKKVIGSKKKQTFNPPDLQDFEPRTYYSVKTSLDSKDGGESSWYALIGKITESREEMERYLAENRLHWPTMEHNDSEAVTTENEGEPTPVVPSLSSVRSGQLSKPKLLKAARDAASEELLECHPLFDLDISSKRLKGAGSQDMHETGDGNINVLAENRRLLALVENLKSKLKDSDEQLNKFQSIETNINNMLKSFQEAHEKSDQTIETKIDEKFSALYQKYDVMFSRLENKFNDLSERLQKTPHSSIGFPESESSAAGVLKESNKIHLGGSLYCNSFCVETLTNPAASHPDWFHALLLGCFWEDAPRIRWRQSKGTIKLTPDEKSTISNLYKQWLESVKTKDPGNPNGPLIRKYAREDVDRLLRELPAYLGDRAYTMSKKGGTTKKAEPKKPDAADQAEENDQAGANKRKYRKKGDLQLEAIPSGSTTQLRPLQPPQPQQLQPQPQPQLQPQPQPQPQPQLPQLQPQPPQLQPVAASSQLVSLTELQVPHW